MPPAGVLRRERRALARAREERIRDLGGLMLEMYRRDQFREDLLLEQCGELVSLEARLQELDALLAAATARRREVGAARCECGAPIIWGSHFCANCGRPVGETPVVACSNCGRPLPADVGFCGFCGTKVEEPVAQDDAEAYRQAELSAEPREAAEPRDAEATVISPSPAAEQDPGGERRADPWEG